MRVFVDAKRRFQVHQRPEDVHAVLEPAFEPADVDAALASLAEWGNLRADVDTSRVTSVADFYRPRYLYQLTREGEAAELALAAYDQALGTPGELQSVALEGIGWLPQQHADEWRQGRRAYFEGGAPAYPLGFTQAFRSQTRTAGGVAGCCAGSVLRHGRAR
jgi:Protein of unknown function (DUF2397)